MTKAFLPIKRNDSCFQEACGTGVAQRVEIKPGHVQFLMNYAVGVLQGVWLNEINRSRVWL